MLYSVCPWCLLLCSTDYSRLQHITAPIFLFVAVKNYGNCNLQFFKKVSYIQLGPRMILGGDLENVISHFLGPKKDPRKKCNVTFSRTLPLKNEVTFSRGPPLLRQGFFSQQINQLQNISIQVGRCLFCRRTNRRLHSVFAWLLPAFPFHEATADLKSFKLLHLKSTYPASPVQSSKQLP